jgi:ABC-2 type transport system ATP-binding protein/lipopolysaccharide transport system ATP-binding protein
MTAIEVKNLNKGFRRVSLRSNYTTLKSLIVRGTLFRRDRIRSDHFQALKNVNLEIPKGQTVGIIGRNGSGKSTLLKLIAGIYKPDSGEVNIHGRISALIELGAGFHPEFSGRENVFINGTILGLSKKEIRERFDRIVEFAEMGEFIDNPVRTYSSGMYMRLGFAVSIHVDPDILLIDEVFAVGDEAFGHKCKHKIDEFKRVGKTIVIVTHNLDYVKEWCHRAVWIDGGAVRAEGDPIEVVGKYRESVAEQETEEMERRPQEGNGSGGPGKRWGNREVEIVSCRLTDAEDRDKTVFDSDGPMKIRIGYKAPKRIEDPVFGIAIHREDGLFCYGTNTQIDQLEIGSVENEGEVCFTIDQLNLIESDYTLSVAVHAKDSNPYDYHHMYYPFRVRSQRKDVGVYRPSHSWDLTGTDSSPRTGAPLKPAAL